MPLAPAAWAAPAADVAGGLAFGGGGSGSAGPATAFTAGRGSTAAACSASSRAAAAASSDALGLPRGREPHGSAQRHAGDPGDRPDQFLDESTDLYSSCGDLYSTAVAWSEPQPPPRAATAAAAVAATVAGAVVVAGGSVAAAVAVVPAAVFGPLALEWWWN